MNQTTLIIIACVIMFVVIPSFMNRTIRVKKLLIGPAIFIYLFYQSLGKDFPVFPISYIVIAIGAILGIIIGYMLRKSSTIVANPAEQTITIKGSFFTFYTFLVIFAVHFIVGYLKSVYPQFFIEVTLTNQLLLMALALTSCLTVGSNGCLFFKYLLEQNKDLP